MLMMMIISATDPFQLGVDEPLPHRAGDRRQWQHRSSYKLFLQVLNMVIVVRDFCLGQSQSQGQGNGVSNMGGPGYEIMSVI